MLNEEIFIKINNLAGHYVWLDRLAIFFAVYSGYILIAVLIYLWFVYRRSRRFIIASLIATIISRGVLTTVIRFFYHHPRPFDVMSVHQLISESGWSFPSGHAAFFFALSVPIFWYNKKLGFVFFATSVFMGLARIYAGVHWPVDVVGGAILGALVGYLTCFLWPNKKTLI